MSDTKPTRSYLDILFDAAADKVSSASGDHGINAFDANACILLDCIERQQRVIGELAGIVTELRAEVASLRADLDADETDDDYMAEHRHAKAQMAAWPRPEGRDE